MSRIEVELDPEILEGVVELGVEAGKLACQVTSDRFVESECPGRLPTCRRSIGGTTRVMGRPENDRLCRESPMAVTNSQSGTNVHEVADGIYRINTPVQIEGGGGFSFNQYLIVDDEPLLFHTGLRKMFPLVQEAVASVMPVERLRYIAFSHVEADECGALNEWLAVAPQSMPLCSTVAALVSVNDLADRVPRPLADGEAHRDAKTRRDVDFPVVLDEPAALL